MPPKEKKPTRKIGPDDSSAAVDVFLAKLQHPCKPEIQAIRKIICGADRSISEGVKWNAPSFRTTEYFATTHLRAKRGVGVIFHRGARVKEIRPFRIDDPDGMLEWLAKDRAMVTFPGLEQILSARPALERIVRQWIKHV